MNYTLLLKNNLTQEITRIKKTVITPEDPTPFRDKLFPAPGEFRVYMADVPEKIDRFDITINDTDWTYTLDDNLEVAYKTDNVLSITFKERKYCVLQLKSKKGENALYTFYDNDTMFGAFDYDYPEGDIPYSAQTSIHLKDGNYEDTDLLNVYFKSVLTEKYTHWEIANLDEIPSWIVLNETEGSESNSDASGKILDNNTGEPRTAIIKFKVQDWVNERLTTKYSYVYIYQEYERGFKDRIFGGLDVSRFNIQKDFYMPAFKYYFPIDVEEGEWSWKIPSYNDIAIKEVYPNGLLVYQGSEHSSAATLIISNKSGSESYSYMFGKYMSNGKALTTGFGDIFQTYTEGTPDLESEYYNSTLYKCVKINNNSQDLNFGVFCKYNNRWVGYEIYLDDVLVVPHTEFQSEEDVYKTYIKNVINIPENDSIYPVMHTIRLEGYQYRKIAGIYIEEARILSDTSYCYVYQEGKPEPTPVDPNLHQDEEDSKLYYHFSDLDINVPDGEYTYYIIPEGFSPDPQNAINKGLLRVGDIETKRTNTEYSNDRKYKEYNG